MRSFGGQFMMAGAGDRFDKTFVYNAYAVLTACRILYSAHHRALVSKDQAYAWAMENRPTPLAARHSCSERESAQESRLNHPAVGTGCHAFPRVRGRRSPALSRSASV